MQWKSVYQTIYQKQMIIIYNKFNNIVTTTITVFEVERVKAYPICGVDDQNNPNCKLHTNFKK